MATPPRIQHNHDLAAKFVVDHHFGGRYPRVTSQVKALPLEISKLVRFGYNPSIVEDGDGMLMAYRYHEGDTLATRLALAEVDYTGKVLSNRKLEVDGEAISVEDPKLFRWRGGVWMVWVQSTWPNVPVSSVVKYGRIEGNKVVNVHQFQPPMPQVIEKNIVPFPNGDNLRLIYECEPEQIIFDVLDGGVLSDSRCPGPRWPYGHIRGGTVPIEQNEYLVRFFHSGLDNEFGPYRRRYFCGVYFMEKIPPFRIVSVSQRPLVYGSELDGLNAEQRGKCIQYKPQVVFPGGAIFRNREFLVSVGVNDSACAILRIKLGGNYE